LTEYTFAAMHDNLGLTDGNLTRRPRTLEKAGLCESGCW
jgi:hypothetical protein